LAYKACSQAPLYDDQTMFWLILRTNANPSPFPLSSCPAAANDKKNVKKNVDDELKMFAAKSEFERQNSLITSCPLDSCMFSASNLRDGFFFNKLANALEDKQSFAVMAHANWMNGKEKKKAALLQTGLWLAQRSVVQNNNINNKNNDNENEFNNNNNRKLVVKSNNSKKNQNNRFAQQHPHINNNNNNNNNNNVIAANVNVTWTCKKPNSRLHSLNEKLKNK
jgi:hypothetical protein